MWKFIVLTAVLAIAVILGIVVSRPAAAADRTAPATIADITVGHITLGQGHAAISIRHDIHSWRWRSHEPRFRQRYGHRHYRHHYYAPNRFDYWHRKLRHLKRHKRYWRDRDRHHRNWRRDRHDSRDGRRHRRRH